MDVDLAADCPTTRRRSIDDVARAIDRVAPLEPTTQTLHLTFNASEQGKKVVELWQSHAVESMTHLLKVSGIYPGCISIETLDFSPFWLQPIVDTLNLAVCVDVGHVILYGFDLNQVLNLYAERITMLHLHGVAAGRDHLSLIHLDPGHRNTISHYLRDFKESVSIEVFNFKRLNESMACFPELMNHEQ
jgi:sugar phosphate isomerase/epimerase